MLRKDGTKIKPVQQASWAGSNKTNGRPTHTTLRSVTRARPCVICKGIDGCSVGADGLHLCRRERGEVLGFEYLGQAKRDEQFALYRRVDDPLLNGRGHQSASNGHRNCNGKHPIDPVFWPELADRLMEALAPERKRELAEALGLPESALGSLFVGFVAKGPHKLDGQSLGPAWSFPETDGSDRCVGISLRYTTGEKKAWPGGSRGLTVPRGWKDRPGPIFVVEGPSDVLAMTAMGLGAVGRPSNLGGTNHLAELLKDLPADRQIIVLGELDPKPNGMWPGRDGAVKVAGELRKRLGRPVKWAMPPGSAKDMRCWALAQSLDPRCADGWGCLGEKFLAELDGKYSDPPSPELPPKKFMCAAIESSTLCANVFPDPVPASGLVATDPEGGWLFEGYLRRSAVTLFSALWKSGKTTLLSHLYREMEGAGPFCGRKVLPCRVLVVTEEPEELWVERRDGLGIKDHVHFLVRPMKTKPDLATWIAFLGHLENIVKRDGIGLVVFDPISTFWPVTDENSAPEVVAALMPLRRLTDAGAAVLLVHHPRKGDGQEATAARGSGALSGFVDIIMELRRFNPNDRADRRRVITAYSRYACTPGELVVEMSQDGLSYTAHGDRATAAARKRAELVRGVLPNSEPGLSVEEVLDALPETDKPGKRTLEQTLGWGAGEGHWRVSGAGKKGDPFRYWMP